MITQINTFDLDTLIAQIRALNSILFQAAIQIETETGRTQAEISNTLYVQGEMIGHLAQLSEDGKLQLTDFRKGA